MMPRVIRPSRSATSSVAVHPVVTDPAERRLGGRVMGILWTIGGGTLFLLPLLPVAPAHVGTDTVLAGLAVAVGLGCLVLVDWDRAHPLLLHVVTVGALVAVSIAVAASGGSQSSAWIPYLWIGLFSAYFLDRRVAPIYLLGCLAAQALPLAYDHGAVPGEFFARLATSAAGYATIGSAIIAGKSILSGLRDRSERLAAEQGALRRVATAVVGGAPAERIHELAAAEVGTLLSADFVAVLRLGAHHDAEVVGAWAAQGLRSAPVGRVVSVRPDSAYARVIASGRITAGREAAPEDLGGAVDCGSSLVAPVLVDGRAWGVLVAGSSRRIRFDRADEAQLEAVCGLLASAVTSLADRAQLAAEALTDPLTGLANQRALQQRLAAETSAAVRHGRPLSVAMIDLDNFKDVNDSGGHEAGDVVLRRVAGALRAVARTEDTLGRIGGDEFMWILPDAVAEDAAAALERARLLIAAPAGGGTSVTASAGVCDTHRTSEPAELIRRADVALYASKTDGRNRVRVYDTQVAGGGSRHAREAWVARTHALAGLRALARAIDARDPATREHSKRVASFAGRLAEAAGWGPDRVTLLREAALVHDVGKLGVPDTLLVKPGPLTAPERRQMTEHAALSARMVGSVLAPEQVQWIGDHHERPDGAGYPRGLVGSEISDGAGLIALAEAWDVMMAGRTYSARKSPGEALAECAGLANAQFTATAVEALQTLADSQRLDSPDDTPVLAPALA